MSTASDIETLRIYVNANIAPNNTRSISAAQMNFILNSAFNIMLGIEDPLSADTSGKNEIVPFASMAVLVVNWTETRKTRFGDAGSLHVELLGEDGKYRWTSVEIVPDVIVNTSKYTIDFGGPATGRVIIT
jgi:hypothetical protein